MSIDAAFYPIGTPGKPWGEQERAQWLEQQQVQRSYAGEVVEKIDVLRERFDVTQYGELDYPSGRYPLFAIRSRNWNEAARSAEKRAANSVTSCMGIRCAPRSIG